MKKFKFRLERVLQFRMALKDERKRDLLDANQRLRDAEQVQEQLNGELARHGLESGEVLLLGELELRGVYRERTKLALEAQGEAVAMRQVDVAAALESYIEAAKDANALEALKKRRLQEFQERIQKLEETALDEIAVQRAGRKLVLARRVKQQQGEVEVKEADGGALDS